MLSLICEMLPLKLLYQNTAFKSSTHHYLLGKVTRDTFVILKLNTFFILCMCYFIVYNHDAAISGPVNLNIVPSVISLSCCTTQHKVSTLACAEKSSYCHSSVGLAGLMSFVPVYMRWREITLLTEACGLRYDR